MRFSTLRLLALCLPLIVFFIVVACEPGDSDSEVAEADDDADQTEDNLDALPSDDPNRYHWDGFTHPFYEGWFFRLVIPDGPSFAFIYSIQNPAAVDGDPSSAQVIVARSGGDSVENVVGIEEFAASSRRFSIRIGDHIAHEREFAGRIEDDGREVRWEVDYEVLEPWPDTMGGLTNVDGLPVNWYVGALRGRGHGEIDWNGERFSFENAAVFQDHNWGDYFPTGYIWLQTQEFGDAGDALAVAGGKVGPFEAGMFIWRRGTELVEIRSQDLNALFRFSGDVETGEVVADIISQRRRYVVTGFFADDVPAILPAPRPDGNVPYTRMAIDGVIRLEVLAWNRGWNLEEEVWFGHAGVEMGGDYGPPVF